MKKFITSGPCLVAARLNASIRKLVTNRLFITVKLLNIVLAVVIKHLHLYVLKSRTLTDSKYHKHQILSEQISKQARDTGDQAVYL